MVCHGQIRLAVAVQVTNRDGRRLESNHILRRRQEGSRDDGILHKDQHLTRAFVHGSRYRDVQTAIAVQVGEGNCPGTCGSHDRLGQHERARLRRAPRENKDRRTGRCRARRHDDIGSAVTVDIADGHIVDDVRSDWH